MRIGIIGSGMIGSTAARLLVAAGHDVAIANTRGPQSLAGLKGELGDRLLPSAVDEAAAFGDVVLIAVPVRAVGDLPAGAFAGKIVVDANNYYPQRDGHIAALDNGDLTSTELLARHLAGARVVKAFNTMTYMTLARSGDPAKASNDRLALFLAGDDVAAKQTVAGLIDELGFAGVDTGGLADGGRLQQPGSPVYGKDLSGAQARAALGL